MTLSDDDVDVTGTTIAFPLHWPVDRPRTPANQRTASRFEVSLGQAIDLLITELERVSAEHIIISSNLPGYERGGIWRPYADQRTPADPGVAVYFVLDHQPTCMTCDCWADVRSNLRSIALTLEAMRGMERWGAAQRRQAFAGFKALPPASSDWRSVLRLKGSPTLDAVKARFRDLALRAHPDQGGSDAEMARLNLALEAARAELGG